MAYNESISNRIREALAHLPHVSEKHMFGGVCFMVNDKMLMGVTANEVMCRIGPEAYEQALELPGCREMTFTGRPMKGYVFVDADALQSQKELLYWINLCLDFNTKAKAFKKKTKAKKTKI